MAFEVTDQFPWVTFAGNPTWDAAQAAGSIAQQGDNFGISQLAMLVGDGLFLYGSLAALGFGLVGFEIGKRVLTRYVK